MANAPLAGEAFSWHIDADPNMLPPSPWLDRHGLYINREPGKHSAQRPLRAFSAIPWPDFSLLLQSRLLLEE